MFTYKDFRTSRIKRTHGVFAGWLEPSTILPMRRALFKTAKRELRIMEMCLTAETKAAIAKIEEANILADAGKEVEPWPTETQPPATSS